jgi:purine-nucleoside phosphorylase
MVSISACNEAKPGDIARAVLMPGDPLRAKYVAETYFENPVCFNTVRNMLGYTGIYKGKRLSVMGSGMGIPSMALYSQELFADYGVDIIIRIGSTGGLTENVELRDIIMAMSASTNSAFEDQYDFPGRFAPTADYGLLEKAVNAAKSLNLKDAVGSVFTADMFYNAKPDANERFKRMGLLSVDMETAGLYILASYLGKKALSILTVSDHIFTGKALNAKERQDSFCEMMEIALKTAWEAI